MARRTRRPTVQGRGGIARRLAGLQGDRRGLRARGCGQDHDRGRRRGHGGGAPGRQGARAHRRPGSRLADALGLEGIGNTERRVPDETFRAAGVKPMGELWAAMLDTKESWDSLIRLHAPDDRTRDEILSNPLYQNISARFVQSHDYIAMERLYEIHSDGDYDLIVVDTPPTRNALDFLDAPERMADFFSTPAPALAHRALPLPAGELRHQTLLPDRRPDPRDPVPRRHRRVLHPLPVHVRRIRRAGRGGPPAHGGPADHLHRGIHARGRAPARGGVLRPGSSTTGGSISAPSSSTRCCPDYLRDRRGAAVAEKLQRRADELAEAASHPERSHAGLTTSQIAAGPLRGGRELPRLPGGGATRGRAAGGLATVPEALVTVPYFDTDIYECVAAPARRQILIERKEPTAASVGRACP